MTRILFFTLLVLGLIGFLVLHYQGYERRYAVFFVFLGVVFTLRQWYLSRKHKLPRWYWWDPRNIFDQFKKP